MDDIRYKETEYPAPENEEKALSSSEMEQITEAVLFAAGHPLSYEKLGELFSIDAKTAKEFVSSFACRYNAPENNRGIILIALEDCCQLCTGEQHIGYIREALGIRRGGNLSNSSIETLSIIAYNQPVTRAYVDTVRGVDSSYAIGSLLDKGLIEAKGRVDAPGRPVLYGTTAAFLRSFGLSSLSELPDVGGPFLPNAVNMTTDDII